MSPTGPSKLRDLAARAWPYLLLCGAACALRAWGLGFAGGSPVGRPDEEIFVVQALRIFGRDHDPEMFGRGWPEAHLFLLHGAQRLYGFALSLWYGREVHLGCLYAVDPLRLTSLSRIVSVVSGTATVPLAAMIARRIVGPWLGPEAARNAGLLAGVFLALDFLHARDSHFGVSDATLCFFLTASLYMLLRVVDRGRLRDFALAGLWLGVAISIKYTALGFGPVVAFACLWRFIAARGSRATTVLGTLLLGGVIVAAFLATSPHALSQREAVWDGLMTHRVRFSEEGFQWSWDPERRPERGIVFHALVSFPASFGWPLFLTAAAGTLLAVLRPRGPAAVVAFFVLFFYGVVLGPTTICFMRYTLPVHSALCALAGMAVATTVERSWRRRVPAWISTLLVPVVCALLVLVPATRILAVDRMFARTDTREDAASWLLAHESPRQVIASEGNWSQIHALGEQAMTTCNAVLPGPLRRRVPTLGTGGYDWAPLVEQGRTEWNEIARRSINDYHNRPQPTDADWLVQGVPLLECGREGRSDGRRSFVSPCYHLERTVSPGTPECTTLYDSVDSFFAPMIGFPRIGHTGPRITIYRNHCRGASRPAAPPARPAAPATTPPPRRR